MSTEPLDPVDPADTADFEPLPKVAIGRPIPVSGSVHVETAALTHPGKVRDSNEDHFLVVRVGRSMQTIATNLPQGAVPAEFGETIYAYGVADGMGGRAAGEVASRLAIVIMVNLVLDTPDWIFGLDEANVERMMERAVKRFRDVNAALLQQARQDPRLFGMGTTLTVAWSLGWELFVAHVGDSRAYLFRQGVLARLTHDHTFAQALLDANVVAPRDVAVSRFRSLLTQALGMTQMNANPQIDRAGLADGDRLLVCTDGLTDMVDDATIAAELARRDSPTVACQRLLERALDRGGKDNVTVVVADYSTAPAK